MGKTRMALRWDNIEILRAIDRIQGETYHGGPIGSMNGLQLMEQASGTMVSEQLIMRGFVQELHIARGLGLLTFRVQGDFRPNQPGTDPNWYPQNLWGFALTVTGQDRARARMVAQPVPDPAEDDGRPVSDLIIRQVTASITEQYAPDEVAIFLAEEGIPRRRCPSMARIPVTRTLSWPPYGGGARKAAG
jgi:hypothetical protein